eukprot:tig00000269_g23712.t1
MPRAQTADFRTEKHAPLAARLDGALTHLYELCVLHSFKPDGPNEDEGRREGLLAAAGRRLRRIGGKVLG